MFTRQYRPVNVLNINKLAQLFILLNPIRVQLQSRYNKILLIWVASFPGLFHQLFLSMPKYHHCFIQLTAVSFLSSSLPQAGTRWVQKHFQTTTHCSKQCRWIASATSKFPLKRFWKCQESNHCYNGKSYLMCYASPNLSLSAVAGIINFIVVIYDVVLVFGCYPLRPT